jgi:hypothetical protein
VTSSCTCPARPGRDASRCSRWSCQTTRSDSRPRWARGTVSSGKAGHPADRVRLRRSPHARRGLGPGRAAGRRARGHRTGAPG